MTVAELKIQGMGCISCANKLQGIMEADETVVKTNISVESGTGLIYLSIPEATAKEKLKGLVQYCVDAGFPTDVSAVRQEGSTLTADRGDMNGTKEGCVGLSLIDGIVPSIAAGLLSSSCCLLQVGLNVLSALDVVHVGCAGFNKSLGPVRTPLRALSVIWLMALWMKRLRSTETRRGSSYMALETRRGSSYMALAFRTTLTLALMFLPELLLLSGGPAMAPPTGDTVLYDLSVEGMGCEACQIHVKQVLERTSGVVGASVDFKAGRARVEVSKDWGFDLAATGKLLSADGYDIITTKSGLPNWEEGVGDRVPNRAALAEGGSSAREL